MGNWTNACIRTVFAGAFTTLILAGCDRESGDQAQTPEGDAGSAQDPFPDAAQWASPTEFTRVFALDESCCETTGRASECWEQDAISDNVVGYILCNTDAECAPGQKCNIGVDLTPYYHITEKEHFSGLCECNTHADCRNASGKGGTCFPSDESSVNGLCGPSICNGYFICSCWGGCEWWDSNRVTNTPDADAADIGLYCCENADYANYDPAVSSELVSFGRIECSARFVAPECAIDADCTTPNGLDADCVSSTCDASGTCIHTNLPDGTACGADADATDCIDGNSCASGLCEVNYFPAGTACGSGADSNPDDCITGFECDAAANCVEAHEISGTTCAIDETAYDPSCWAGFCGAVTDSSWSPTFDGASFDGICHEILKGSPDNDSCAAGGVTVGDLGSFSNADETVLPAVTASTSCATSTSLAAAPNCVDESGAPFGSGAGDVVYSFGYTTTGDAQQQLYAFIITVEADFRAVVYTETDQCTDGAVNGHPCQWQPELDAGGAAVPWELSANNQGRDWDGNDQRCSVSGTSGYQWCTRGSGSWTYPDDPTACQFEADGTYSCDSTATHVAQTFVYPISDESATAHRVYIHVDGAGSADSGNFTLTVERRAWSNGQCERVNDAPRVYDITDVSTPRVYRGNLEGVANSTHSDATPTCGGYDCTPVWGGVTAAHGSGTANEFWPNAAYFKIQPTATTEYCIRTEHLDLASAISPIIEVRRLDTSPLHNERDLCQGNTSAVAGAAAVAGVRGVNFMASEGETYLVLLSENGPSTAPCTHNCNYRLVVKEGTCAEECPPVQIEAETMTLGAPIGIQTWAPGIAYWRAVNASKNFNFTGQTTISILARASNDGPVWPTMRVSIGGTTVLETTVTSNTFHTITGTFPAMYGNKTITISMLNDSEWVYGGDTNLYLDSFTLRGADCSPGATPPCSPATIEAESISHTTGSSAASPSAWVFWSNGSAYTNYNVTGYTTISVVAKGSSDGAVWPNMIATVGGTKVLDTTVGATTYRTYSASFLPQSGTKELRVSFTNDSNVHGGDANLWVDSISLGCGNASCTPVTYQAESISATTGTVGATYRVLWGSGTIYTDHFFSSHSSISVRAKGSSDGPIWPNMTVEAGGVKLIDATVNSTGYIPYKTKFAPEYSTKEIRVNFTNDSNTHGGDANLWVDSITVGCDGSIADPPIGSGSPTVLSCVPLGCASAPTVASFNSTGYYSGCIFIPYNGAYHQSNWGWDPAYWESLSVNGNPVSVGENWAAGSMPATCNGGWYVDIVFNLPTSHLEIKS